MVRYCKVVRPRANEHSAFRGWAAAFLSLCVVVTLNVFAHIRILCCHELEAHSCRYKSVEFLLSWSKVAS